MKTTKMSLANMQGKLSRIEMKNIMAGSGDSSGTCCAHNAAWSYYNCGISMSYAQQLASQYASGSGQSGYWCCSSC
ncbi:hypothetical protein [Ferruginibacter sp. SUN106]|uniref:hypothetical protein n=1 Tax=Ferruginibacter sp. SUN106 TaxID=2978348 RepID=UPI003D363B3A